MVGISIVLAAADFSTMTFCALIKQHFPHIHVTIGGNTVTRLRDVLPESPLFQYFDSAVVYEGETAFLQLVEAVGAKRELWPACPTPSIRTTRASMTSALSYAEDMAALPPPDFDGLAAGRSILCRRTILPYLATRGCYWGRCEFCDHGEGYTAGYRSKKIQDVLADIKYLRDKYGVRHFHFTDESYPPALFRKLARGLVEEKMDIFWTTHMRFEKSLLEDGVWEDAKQSGCRYLHFGYESGDRAGAEADGQGDDDGGHDEASQAHGRRRHLEPLHGILRLPRRNEGGSLAVGGVPRTEQELCPFARVRHVRSRPA